jgi:hypothetical protein
VSVTFSTAIDPDAPVVWFIECMDGLRRDLRETDDYAAMADLLEVHGMTCLNQDCREYGASLAVIHSGPEVNVSNRNAADILEALGLPFEDGSGSLPADQFLGRVLTALAVAPQDPGVPMHELVPGESTIFGPVSEFGARFIDCGRREGYLQERLLQLEEVATHSMLEGREVSWG